MYKKAWCTWKIFVLSCQAIAFLLSRHRCFLNFLLYTIHCDPSETEFSQCQIELLLLIVSETFFDSSVVSSFLVTKACWTNRALELWRENSRRVRTHERNSGETVHRLGTVVQSIFCAQSGASIRLTVWECSGESRYPGAFPPVLENFRHAFSPGRLTSPGSPRMVIKALTYEGIWKTSKSYTLPVHTNTE